MRLLALLVIVLAAWAGAASAQALPNHVDPRAREVVPNLAALPSIRFLTTADFPPFNYRDAGGELIGFNVDLARGVCELLDIACTVQAWPWDQAANALADNQGDALIAGLALSAETAERFDFSATYLALPARFVTRLADIEAFEPRQLTGRPVAVRKGSAHEQFLRRYLPTVTPVPFDSELEALAAVQRGQAFGYFGDAMRAAFWLNDNSQCCGFAGAPYFRPDLFGEGFAVAVPGGRDDVRLAINYALARMKRDGLLDELYLRWFPISFY